MICCPSRISMPAAPQPGTSKLLRWSVYHLNPACRRFLSCHRSSNRRQAATPVKDGAVTVQVLRLRHARSDVPSGVRDMLPALPGERGNKFTVPRLE